MYHLSAVYLGQVCVLRPRIPRNPAPRENSTIPRVCVAPTIAGCLRALPRAHRGAIAGCLRALRTTYYAVPRWYVYVVVDAPTVAPIAVPDAGDTGERWLLHPTETHYAGTVSGAL